MELLVPAGNWDCLVAAVQYGADAVYLSGQRFGARKYADNFDFEALRSATEYCHLYGVRIYVTVNTLIFDREREELHNYVDYLSQIGVDAVIVQDLGAAAIIRNAAPNLPIHASTQMVIHDLPGVLAAEEMGIKRVVLARELSIAEIRHIAENTDVELEVFGHGALCMSYSGQCYMSSMIGGRSGNRGSCAQPCRLVYGLDGQNGQFLSLKDLCSLNHIETLKKAGITSLKIEGRMKGPNYVSTVTDVYRACIDGRRPTKEDFERLLSAFDRDGFTDGYLTGEIGLRMFSYSRPENPYHHVESVEKKRKIAIKGKCSIQAGQPAVMSVFDGMHEITTYGSIVEVAEKVPLSRERVLSQLEKTGDTPFEFSTLDLDLGLNCALPIKEINALRRTCLSKLSDERRLYGKRISSGNGYASPEVEKAFDVKPSIYVSVESHEQALAVSEYTDVLFLSPELWKHRAAYGCECVMVVPRMASEQRMAELRNVVEEDGASVMISDLGQLRFFKDCTCYGSFELNAVNTEALLELKKLGVNACGVSYELSLRRIRDLGKPIPLFVFAYGHMPLMLTKNCLIHSAIGKCACPAELTDRKGETFSVSKGEGCRSEIRNGTVLFNADKLSDFENIGLSALFLKMTTESPQTCAEIVKMYRGEMVSMPMKFTRGHLYKNIE